MKFRLRLCCIHHPLGGRLRCCWWKTSRQAYILSASSLFHYFVYTIYKEVGRHCLVYFSLEDDGKQKENIRGKITESWDGKREGNYCNRTRGRKMKGNLSSARILLYEKKRLRIHNVRIDQPAERDFVVANAGHYFLTIYLLIIRRFVCFCLINVFICIDYNFLVNSAAP